MREREFGRTGLGVGEIGFGAWAIGADRGPVGAIPGAKSVEQARANAGAADLAPLGADVMAAVKAIDAADIRPAVHGRW